MGGMETYSKRLSDELDGVTNIRRIVLEGHDDGSVPKVSELIGFAATTAFKLIFGRGSFDVIHVADMASWPLALLGRLRYPRSRVVISSHGTDVSYPRRGGVKGNLYGAYLKLGARLLPNVTIIANSKATASCTQSYGFRDTVVVPLAAEVDRPEQALQSGGSILFAGRLIRLKGCAWFVREVLPHLPSHITLDVAGTIWDDHEFSALNTSRVRYLGVLDQKTLWQAYADALCVVVPNIDIESGEFEGFGLVATEAAAAGGVVLASRHAGLLDAVLDGRTGFLLPVGKPAAWVQKIVEISGWSTTKRRDFIGFSQASCAEKFSWKRVARDTLAVYDTERDRGFRGEVIE